MKRVLLLLGLILIGLTCFAQTDSAVVANGVTVICDSLWANIVTWTGGYIGLIFVIATILDHVLASVKWTPANSVLQFLWMGFKSILHYLDLTGSNK